MKYLTVLFFLGLLKNVVLAQSQFGYSDLSIALWKGHSDKAEELFLAGNLCEKENVDTVLHHIIKQKDLNTLKIFLQYDNIDINHILPIANKTPLMLAAYEGYIEIAEYLLEQRAHPDILNSCDETALSLAIQKGHKDMVKLLLQKGAHLNIMGTSHNVPTFLAMAANKRHSEVVDVLLDHGDDLLTSFKWSIYTDKPHIVRILVKKRILINRKDRLGNTPLLIASRKGYVEIVQILLANGANPLLKNNEQESAISVTTNKECLFLLKRHIKQSKKSLFSFFVKEELSSVF